MLDPELLMSSDLSFPDHPVDREDLLLRPDELGKLHAATQMREAVSMGMKLRPRRLISAHGPVLLDRSVMARIAATPDYRPSNLRSGEFLVHDGRRIVDEFYGFDGG